MGFSESMKFNLSLKVKEVRVNPIIYGVMKVTDTVKYDAHNDKMMWNGYEVFVDENVKDIEFKFEINMEEIFDE